MTAPGNVADTVAVSLARTVVPGDFIGVGLGTPIALVAALVSRELTVGVHVLAGGALDVEGDVDVWLGGAEGTKGRAAGYVPHLDSMDMAERQSMTLQFLRPAQVDGHGNLNTSRIGSRQRPDVRFPGGLATADVPRLLSRVVVYLPDHRVRNLPTEVSFKTAAGSGFVDAAASAAGVVTLVTDRAVIDLSGDGARLVSFHEWSSVADVVENTGFELVVNEHTGVTAPPTKEEAAALTVVDPDRRRDREVKARAGNRNSEVTA